MLYPENNHFNKLCYYKLKINHYVYAYVYPKMTILTNCAIAYDIMYYLPKMM